MCVPACEKKIAEALSRRDFLKNAGKAALGLGAGVAAGAGLVSTAAAQTMSAPSADIQTLIARRVVDLTHTLGEDFQTYFGEQQFELETLTEIDVDGFNMSRWHLHEHTGTHLDAPFHFSKMDSADQIPIGSLVGALAIIDIRSRAEDNADAEVTPEDIMNWESRFGDLPAGAIVAMNSGWDKKVKDAGFRNVDDDGVMHFPGFHVEACQYLLEKDVSGIMVDTLSLDYGKSADFATHFSWLPANRWGIENVANLSELPASGATVIVGAPKIKGASGGPSRVIALA